MADSHEYVVSLGVSAQRRIAAVQARLPIRDVPSSFARYLDEVYAAARTHALRLDGQNVFVYRDAANHPNEADVTFGVGVMEPFEAIGRVQPTLLPAGVVATTTHWGSYARLGGAHDALIDWCRAHGHRRAGPGGPRWEVYGHWTEDAARLRTDVFYLLEPDASAR
jgi:effector-binding domain-containing protein